MLKYQSFTQPLLRFLVAGVSVTLFSCSASTGSKPPPTGGTGGVPSGSGGATGPAAGNSGRGPLSNAGSDQGPMFFGSGGGATIDPSDAGQCKTEIHEGERRPLDMYFLVDQSGSMAQGNPNKWSAVTTSLATFLMDPANAGTGAGIGYFPFVAAPPPSMCTEAQNGMNGCICILGICIDTSAILQGGGSCNVADYSKPDVPIAQLLPVGQMIQASLMAHSPNGGTPTYPALQGAYQYVSGWAKANPGRRTVLVLATDGEPTGCDQTNQVANIATDLVAPALAATPSISTFVIGVGNSLTSLNDLAKAGGTNQAFIVDTGGDVAKQFAMALDAIRGQAASCEFAIPNDGTVDPTKVNATYTAPGGPAIDAYGVADQSKCAGTDPLWYFSPDKAQLVLCPATCDTLKTKGGSVQVVLGCPTKPRKIQ